MTEGKPSGFRNLAEKAATGDYEIVDPLDYKIMDLLPPQGALFADLYPIGTSAREVVKKLPALPTSLVGSRLAILKKQGLVVKTIPVGRGDTNKGGAWQITPTGKKLLADWKERYGHDSQS